MSSIGNPIIQQPVGAMVTVDPFRSVIQGLIQGAQMHQQIQAAQDQHMAQQRNAAQQDRNNRIQDIQQQMLLNDTSRPVSPAGTVTTDPTTVPNIMNSMTGGVPDVGGAPLGGPLAAMQTTLPGVVQKADPSRTVSYTTQDGQKISRELYTPEEQNARAAQAKAATVNAGTVPVKIPANLKDYFGGVDMINVPPTGVAGILSDITKAARQNERIDISPEDQKQYGVPANLPGDLYDNFLSFKARDKADQAAAERAQSNQQAQNDRQTAQLGAQADNQAARESATDSRADQRDQRQRDADQAKEDRLTNGQVVGATLKKQAALSSAEAAYRTEVNRLGFNTKLAPADKQAQIGVAQKRLRDSKQDAQNAYEENLSALGKPIPHVEYPAVGEQQQVAPGTQQPPAAQAAPQPPPLNLLKEGKVTIFGNGQRWALRNGKPVQVTAPTAQVQ